MSDTSFTEVDGPSAVYRIDSFEGVHPTAAPQRARSKFAEEYDVPYNDCRAQVATVGSQNVVLVGYVGDNE